MCLASPVKIISILGKKAKVEDSHGQKTVHLILIKKPKIGDYLLAHGNLAVAKIDKNEAEEINKLNQCLES